MIKVGTAVGMAVGYLAANEQVRQKLWTAAKDAWQSPQAQAVEQKVAAKLPSITHRLPDAALAPTAEVRPGAASSAV